MWNPSIPVTIAVLWWCGLLLGAQGPSHAVEQEVFRKAVTGDRHIVVVRGPDGSPQTLHGMVDARFNVDQWANIYTIRVELREKDQAPLILASRCVTDGQQHWAKGFDVLDILVEPGEFTVAVAQGGDILVWRIGLPPDSSSLLAGLDQKDWSPYAAAYRRDRTNVKVSLRRSGDGKLTVEVADLISGQDKYPHAIFVQLTGQWKFVRE